MEYENKHVRIGDSSAGRKAAAPPVRYLTGSLFLLPR